MLQIRRWYIFLVAAISLQVVTWGMIALLRNLFISGLDAQLTQIALQIAIIVIGLPFFLVHWLWAQRLAKADDAKKTSVLRHLLFELAAVRPRSPCPGLGTRPLGFPAVPIQWSADDALRSGPQRDAALGGNRLIPGS